MRFLGFRQLCFAGLLGTFALAGCGGGSGHPNGGGGGGTGYGIFSWRIFDIEDTVKSSAGFACNDVGGGTVVVTLTDQATNAVYTEPDVNCADGQMSTGYLPTGVYTVGFQLFGDPAIYGSSDALLDSFTATGTFHVLGGANDFRAEYAPFAVQRFLVSWDLYYQSAPTTCAAEGGVYVYLDFLVDNSATWVTTPFNCNAGTGTSYTIPLMEGTVQLGARAQWSLSLIDASGKGVIQQIDGAPVMLPSNTDVSLGRPYFSF
jgi:hypothetical protein